MLINLDDGQLRATLRLRANNRVRLILDYPGEEPYRSRVLTALSDLLRPTSASTETTRAITPNPQEIEA